MRDDGPTLRERGIGFQRVTTQTRAASLCRLPAGCDVVSKHRKPIATAAILDRFRFRNDQLPSKLPVLFRRMYRD